MKRRYLAVVVTVLLLLGPRSSSADPANWASLAQIIAWLQQINGTLNEINGLVEGIRTSIATVYPRDVLRQIEIVLEPVDSIRAEVAKLACNWRFTPRVEQLRLALFQGGNFCRRDWNALFGAPTLTADWDLEHYYDWSAVRRLNLIRTRYEKGPERAEQAAWLAREATLGRDALDGTQPYSPARLLAEAVGAGRSAARQRHDRDGRHPDGHARTGPGSPQRQASETPPGARVGVARLPGHGSARATAGRASGRT